MLLPEGPDSISFYNAKAKTEQKVTWGFMSLGSWVLGEHISRTPKITLLTLERQRNMPAEGNTESPGSPADSRVLRPGLDVTVRS